MPDPGTRISTMKIDKNAKILIAEDEPILRKVLHSMLVHFGFRHIYEAHNGVEALELGRKHQPRYALLDIYMPQMDGWEVAQYFKKELPDTILIMITGSRDIADIDKSFVVEVDGYIYKPFQQDVLLKKMLDLARQRQLLKDS